jgi:hypothetical protein
MYVDSYCQLEGNGSFWGKPNRMKRWRFFHAMKNEREAKWRKLSKRSIPPKCWPGWPDWLNFRLMGCILITLSSFFQHTRGRCYDHNFLRLLTIFCDFWQFSAKKPMLWSKFLHNLALFWVKNANFFAKFFAEKYLKNHNIGPRSSQNFWSTFFQVKIMYLCTNFDKKWVG